MIPLSGWFGFKSLKIWTGVAVLLLVWGFFRPPRFVLNLTKRVEPTAAVGGKLVDKYGCRNCHRIGGKGGLVAPDLDPVVRRAREVDPAFATLRLWLRNPQAVRPGTPMPNFRLSDSEIEAILLYLNEQAGGREASPNLNRQGLSSKLENSEDTGQTQQGGAS